MNPKYDAIIVGAGHNGVVTAAYLARAGRKVLIVPFLLACRDVSKPVDLCRN
jgi:ribulose 1,5-bisphosphate synthetase/thiazole synthase